MSWPAPSTRTIIRSTSRRSATNPTSMPTASSIVLLTDAVNALTPDCTNGRILGYFYGGDMLNVTGSNHAEIFYAMVPAPNNGSCTGATRKNTLDRLKPTLIHEFQHMISFNQHALVRGSPVGGDLAQRRPEPFRRGAGRHPHSQRRVRRVSPPAAASTPRAISSTRTTT